MRDPRAVQEGRGGGTGLRDWPTAAIIEGGDHRGVDELKQLPPDP